MGLEVERFSACDGSLLDTGYGKVYNSELGGTISHTRVIKKIKDEKFERVLILEDDVEFIKDFMEKAEIAINELPKDWDILFFGGNHTGGYRMVSEHIGRVYKTFALHCYAVNGKAAADIYDNMIRFIGHVLGSNHQLTPSIAADFFMAKLHPIMNVYSVFPNISWQRESFSDIQHDVMNYDFLKNEG